MYFDWIYYRKVLTFAWSQKSWPGRNAVLRQLLIVTPLAYLVHSLFFLLDYLFFPRLWWQKVEKPIFILGHARSGTTLMQRLMSADGDRFSDFLFWETLFPSATQKKLIGWLGALDRAFGAPIYKRLKQWDDKTFGPWRHIHNQGLWIAEEDQFVMKSAFVTQQWATDLPLMHKVDIFHIDEMDASHRRKWLKHYRACVKRQLVLKGSHKTHLCKNPVMSGWINGILEEFPDARIVIMMRNPEECIPSVLKLLELSYQARGWTKAQYGESLSTMTDIAFETFQIPKASLEKNAHVPQIVVDYRELLANPKSVVEKVYSALGLEISAEFSDWLEERQKIERTHNTNFNYSIDEFDDLSLERIQTELADFYEEWQWHETGSM